MHKNQASYHTIQITSYIERYLILHNVSMFFGAVLATILADIF